MPRVVVIGGGPAGLAAAHRLSELSPGLEVSLLEKSDRLGGMIRTTCEDGFVIERGPESVLRDKPAALDLAARVGVLDRTISTSTAHSGALVACRGELVPIPEGFSLLVPSKPSALARAGVVSRRGSLRASLERYFGARHRDDVSVGRFVRDHFGSEVLERLAQPIVSGIYGGDPDRIGLAATLPRFIEMEKTGSVIRALERRGAASDQSARGARYSLFVSFDEGLQVLTDAVASRVGGRATLGAGVTALERRGRGFALALGEGRAELADAVIVALPGRAAAGLLAPLDAKLGGHLASVEQGSAAAVSLIYREDRIPELTSFGFVVPALEGRPILATTYSSVKWPGRAPSGFSLVRVFLGGERWEGLAHETDEGLVQLARHELRELARIEARPERALVDRYTRAMPRYAPGHLARVADVRRRLDAIPGLFVAGTILDGVGVPDAIRTGEAAASGAHVFLSRP
jgi:protoporphyrinogen/coproporphyrinogen III oxidase